MDGKDIIAFLVELLEDQEQIKIEYRLGGDENDDIELNRVCGYKKNDSSRSIGRV